MTGFVAITGPVQTRAGPLRERAHSRWQPSSLTSKLFGKALNKRVHDVYAAVWRQYRSSCVKRKKNSQSCSSRVTNSCRQEIDRRAESARACACHGRCQRYYSDPIAMTSELQRQLQRARATRSERAAGVRYAIDCLHIVACPCNSYQRLPRTLVNTRKCCVHAADKLTGP